MLTLPALLRLRITGALIVFVPDVFVALIIVPEIPVKVSVCDADAVMLYPEVVAVVNDNSPTETELAILGLLPIVLSGPVNCAVSPAPGVVSDPLTGVQFAELDQL